MCRGVPSHRAGVSGVGRILAYATLDAQAAAAKQAAAGTSDRAGGHGGDRVGRGRALPCRPAGAPRVRRGVRGGDGARLHAFALASCARGLRGDLRRPRHLVAGHPGVQRALLAARRRGDAPGHRGGRSRHDSRGPQLRVQDRDRVRGALGGPDLRPRPPRRPRPRRVVLGRPRHRPRLRELRLRRRPRGGVGRDPQGAARAVLHALRPVQAVRAGVRRRRRARPGPAAHDRPPAQRGRPRLPATRHRRGDAPRLPHVRGGDQRAPRPPALLQHGHHASVSRDDSGVRQFARKLQSAPGKKDGLYWPADGAKSEEVGPIGPLLRDAPTRAPGIRTTATTSRFSADRARQPRPAATTASSTAG